MATHAHGQEALLGIFNRFAQVEEAADTAEEDKTFKILKHIIPNHVINGRSLSGNGFLADNKPIADTKTLSQGGICPDDRTGNPNEANLI